MTKGEKKKIGRPSELADCLVKAKEYLLGDYETFGDVVPSVAGLACYLGKHKSSMYSYAEQSKEFSDTLEAIKTLQENKLINGGLTSSFNPTITKLMLSNHGYNEKQKIDHQSSDGSMSPKPTRIELVTPKE
ncbi:DNA-packaging protein [Gilliamella sp. B3766]|uniref:DNA-packaging protein n=2 Tax=unclassified Gilliamella TaxID=2685620 RepID=UPI00226A0860|nr:MULTISPECIES: DNA-packaging protein [unclassified Gilliamella]MCX8607149.1 DNA-packaging protein [Gilliamella sp. B3771]MCX8611853.1 DNA-packaging protein [Gilliamella sp. B3891]MCX8614303.1 DNA-packaging protein [Gilliamella sp. B3773]MCX8615977.1 DNA-packaging protein [Gilliamella sp. B3770]MCX8621558.1 DNA-packaging protein [Gilliamella sp. B3892]